MESVLLFGGVFLMIVGWIWLLIGCFKESILWGIGGLFCGFVALIYGVMNFSEMKIPVILYSVGFVLSIAGQMMAS